MYTVTCLRQRLLTCSSGVVLTKKLRLGYVIPAVQHYSTLAAGQGTPSLEWTASFGHDSEGTRYGTDAHLVHGTEVVEGTGHGTELVGGTDLQTALLGGYVMPVVEHYSTLVVGQGILSLEWTATFGHNSEGTRYGTDVVEGTGHGTDLVGGTDLVEWTDLVGWIEHVEGLLLDNNLDDAH
ncbi:hypothetical protein KY289_028816 [Solanum tuberosum]|nr:hypothetical protein KY289_028816 [Solanum tuberosum]KAH0662296.1 hypothetical protein KY284_027227 [Solanum tuberosum]